MKNTKEFMLDEAKELTQTGNFEDAIKKLDEINNVYNHQDRNYWFNKGQYFLEIQNYSEAIKCFNKDLELNKKSYRTFMAKGITMYHGETYHEAIECFNNALEIKFAEYLKNTDQAKNLKNVKKFESAIKYYDIANHSDNIDSEFWKYKALSLFKIKKYDEAADCFDNILKNEPDNAEILYNKAKCEVHLEKIESCTALLEKACRLDSSMKETLKDETLFKGLPKEKLLKII